MKNRSEAEQQAKKLVSRMTLEEKASQLLHQSPAIPRLGIPAYCWWNEALHGVARAGTATMFPQAIGMAAMFDPDLMEKLGDLVSTEGRAKYNAFSAEGDRGIYKGLTYWSPNINIFRDPRWGRGQETYGEDPYLTAENGVAYIRGIQGDGQHLKAAACAKHFAVHSGPENQRHHFDARVSPKDLTETYLAAFEACVKQAHVEAVMGAYNRVNGEPCCGSKALLVDKLRGEWGFRGHVVSDCWAVADFHKGHMVTDTPAESAALALNMGCDLNCGETYAYILSAVEQGLLSEAAVTKACEHLMTTRYMLGILGEEGSEYDKIPYEVVECPEHLELGLEAGRKACVLLKNNGILPLNPEKLQTIGVIGPNANSRYGLVGNYCGTASRYITVLEGIQDEFPGRVLYSQGCALADPEIGGMRQGRLSEAVAVAKHSDAVVLVLGLDETMESEGDNADDSGDKKNLLLPAVQRELMERVLEEGKPTVVILISGSAIDLSAAQEKADAVMTAWYPGALGGQAVADLLFGRESPSGKLPVTFYHNEALDEMPDFTDYSMRERTYRYYTGTPLYPFGYGLTYGDTAVTKLDADRTMARVRVINRGSRATEDVVQLYIHDNQSEDAPVNPSLCGFRRVFLEPGQETELEIPIPAAALTVVSREGQRIPGSGSWKLYAGFGQPDARTEELTGKTCCSVQIG